MHRIINNMNDPLLSGIVEGEAIFIQMNRNEILYQEKGIFHTNNHNNFNIYQEYIYVYNEKTKLIEKYFSENKHKSKLFYVMANNQLKICKGTHKCKKDLYSATYDFTEYPEMNRFMLTYQTHGPFKNYSSQTEYVKKKFVK